MIPLYSKAQAESFRLKDSATQYTQSIKPYVPTTIFGTAESYLRLKRKDYLHRGTYPPFPPEPFYRGRPVNRPSLHA
jgi:hypothetical protein